jgi:hypothetical protein
MLQPETTGEMGAASSFSVAARPLAHNLAGAQRFKLKGIVLVTPVRH